MLRTLVASAAVGFLSLVAAQSDTLAVALQSYDFIIVGGGTAGCVLASRLSENSNTSVLLIEAGGSAENVLGSTVPFLGITLPGTPLDWNFTTVPQGSYNNKDVIPYPRGHVLGGSSSINLLTFNSGSKSLWDNWASITGDSGWSFKSIRKFYNMTSHLVPPADGHDTTGQVNPAFHGNGPVEVSVAGFPTELDNIVVKASKQLGGRFFYNEDFNSGDMTGVGYMPSSIGHSKRSSSATSYLAMAKSRSNLKILTNSQVTKLYPGGLDAGFTPIFNLVEYASSSGKRTIVQAKKEVVLSAGVFMTPQILSHSGIGPRSQLQKKGIVTIVDLPDVGLNLSEHPSVPLYYSVNSNKTFDTVFRDTTVFNSLLAQWNTTGQGLFADSPANTQLFIKFPANSSVFDNNKDPASGPFSGNYEVIPIDAFSPLSVVAPPPTGFYLTLLIGLVASTSRGIVTTASSDPFAKPVIDPKLFTSSYDMPAMVQAIKDAQTFLKADSWQGFINGTYGPFVNVTTDTEIENYIRGLPAVMNHAAGTASMSPVGAKWGVVDPDLRVKGVSGLRVVDTSIFPTSPECHTQAVVYTVAERAVDLIKTKYNL